MIWYLLPAGTNLIHVLVAEVGISGVQGTGRVIEEKFKGRQLSIVKGTMVTKMEEVNRISGEAL